MGNIITLFYRSLEAVQKHMVDKGHSIINTEGDAYLEYSDYYDFSKVTT